MPRAPSKPRRPSTTDRPIATKLREVVRKRGLTPYTVGKLADVDPGIVSRFMAGERDITLGTFDRIAAALGLRLAELAHRTRRAPDVPAVDPAAAPDPGG